MYIYVCVYATAIFLDLDLVPPGMIDYIHIYISHTLYSHIIYIYTLVIYIYIYMQCSVIYTLCHILFLSDHICAIHAP